MYNTKGYSQYDGHNLYNFHQVCVCVCQSNCTPTCYEPGKAEASVIVEAVWQQCISRSGVATKQAKEDGNCPPGHSAPTISV